METILWNSVLDKYFDEQTMSLHLKADRPVLRKKGTPGNWQPVVDPNEIMTKENFNQLVDALFKEVETRDDAFLEINRELSKVMQVGPYRNCIRSTFWWNGDDSCKACKKDEYGRISAWSRIIWSFEK